jgi:hypothetical protein
VKNLGIIMDERFSWCDQAKVVRRNVDFVLSRLWHFVGVTLVESLIVPYFYIVMKFTHSHRWGECDAQCCI